MMEPNEPLPDTIQIAGGCEARPTPWPRGPRRATGGPDPQTEGVILMRTLGVAAITVVLLTASAIGVSGQDRSDSMTTDELLAGMVTEHVEPGVVRVVNDGVRDPTFMAGGYPDASVDITPDGAVWLSGRDAMYRLGDEATFQVPDDIGWLHRLDVGPDGSLWSIAHTWSIANTSDYIQSFDGQTWIKRTGPTGDDLLLGSLAIGPDGTVWVAASDRDKYCPDTDSADCIGTVLLRVEDDGTMTAIDGWADVYEGDVAYDELAVSPDGDVWLIGMVRWDGPEAEVLLRFDGEEWEVVPGPEGFMNVPWGNSVDIGADGALWVNTSNGYWGAQGVGGLARFDDPGWTMFGEADGVEPWGAQGFIATGLLEVAPDGSLWMNGSPGDDGCGGVAHYDGTTWTSHLRPVCVHDLSIAPDGSAFVRADLEQVSWGDTSWKVGLFVIRPEPGATTE